MFQHHVIFFMTELLPLLEIVQIFTMEIVTGRPLAIVTLVVKLCKCKEALEGIAIT